LGTQMLKDINPGGNGNPQYFTEYNGKLYFQADSGDPYAGYELWVTDGTTAGTTIVSSIADQGGIYEPKDFVVMGNWLYFSAASDWDSRELWKTDGTLAGTQMVKNINTTNYEGSNPQNLKLYNNKIYFTAN